MFWAVIKERRVIVSTDFISWDYCYNIPYVQVPVRLMPKTKAKTKDINKYIPW